MKKILLLFCVLASMFVSAADFVKAKVIRVIDGDTIVISIEGQETKVRLAAIDAPELKQPGGEESKQWLQKQIGDKDIYLKIVETDQYGREVAFVYTDKQTGKFYANNSINFRSVRESMSWLYCTINTNLENLEDKHIAESKGIFALSKTPPWEFRETQRDEKHYIKWKEFPFDASFESQWLYNSKKCIDKAHADFNELPKTTNQNDLIATSYIYSRWHNNMFLFIREELWKINAITECVTLEMLNQKEKIEELEVRIKKLEEIISKGVK